MDHGFSGGMNVYAKQRVSPVQPPGQEEKWWGWEHAAHHQPHSIHFETDSSCLRIQSTAKRENAKKQNTNYCTQKNKNNNNSKICSWDG